MLKSLFPVRRSPPAEGGGNPPAPIEGDGSWTGQPPASEDELVGKSLNGTYVVEKVLGVGGMGRVYEARHTRIEQKRFAIKVLRPEFTSNTEVLARFRREAQAAACISHPNVVGVYDVDTTREGFAYLVCEFLDGVDLAGLLQRSKRIDVPTAVHIAIQICSALEAAHARGVVHRDLKPHNVFVLAESSGAISPRPSIKVLDFGLSRFMDSDDTQLTRAGVIMGTPAYMSPEQASAKVADHRSDVYGVGAILYAALTGKPPFEAEHLQGVVMAVLTEEPVPARQKNPSIPENLELVIQRAMAKDPDDRYQNMSELRQALEPFADADEFFQKPGTERRPAASRGSRTMLEAEALAVSTARPRLVLFALLGLLLFVAGLASSVTSVELVTGKFELTNTELALVVLCAVGTLLTPGLLLVRRLKKTVWPNHARVLELLESVRAALLLALVSYGAAALLVRVLDDVLARFALSPLYGRAPGSEWQGWNAIFFLVALSSALLAGLRQRLSRNREALFVAKVLSPLVALAVPLLALLAVHLGLVWRVASTPEPVLAAAQVSVPKPGPSAAAAVEPRPAPQPLAPAVPEKAEREPVLRAPHDELARAIASGVDGLLPLAERYPRDAAVLKPLVLAFASRATGLADAMTIAGRLFDAAPEEARDPDLRFLIKRGAGAPGEASKLAFALLTERMGSTGPDVLYELSLSGSKGQKRAEELLQQPEIRKRSTPALLIARELRAAGSCAARLPLLERAAALGDERSVAILSPLSTGTKRGCGKWKRNPCQPACAAEAGRYNQALAQIQTRLNATRP
jgi:serine/threonine protein kinase